MAPSSSAPDTSWASSPAPGRSAWLGLGWRLAPPPWRPAGSGSLRSSPACNGACPAGGASGRRWRTFSPRRWALADESSPPSAGWRQTGIWGGSSDPATWRMSGQVDGRWGGRGTRRRSRRRRRHQPAYDEQCASWMERRGEDVLSHFPGGSVGSLLRTPSLLVKKHCYLELSSCNRLF